MPKSYPKSVATIADLQLFMEEDPIARWIDWDLLRKNGVSVTEAVKIVELCMNHREKRLKQRRDSRKRVSKKVLYNDGVRRCRVDPRVKRYYILQRRQDANNFSRKKSSPARE